MRKKVVIVGAGLGGLSAAIHLAIKGYDVTVFEKNSFVGGKAGKIEINGFRFDTGPTLLTMPFVLENLFEISGNRLEDYLNINKKEIICKYFFEDGSTFNEYADRKQFFEEFERFTSESSQKLQKYLNYSKRIYDLTADIFLFNSITDWNNLFSLKSFKTLFNVHHIDPFRTVHQANNAFFKSTKMVQIFDRYTTYNGSNPFEAPATLNIIPYVELEYGGYYVEGGIAEISNSLAHLARKVGVNIFTGTKVEKILIDDRMVKGVKIGDEKIYADVVISNADLYYTFKNLINNTNVKEANRYISQELSTSALIFFVGVSGNHEQLEMDNIFFSKDYEKEFQQLFDEKVIPNDPTIHIHISSKAVRSDAPENKENWYIMINTPSKEQNQLDLDLIQKRLFEKIKRMTGIDLESKAEFIYSRTPNELEEITSGYLGSLYGPSSNNRYSAFLRQKNKSQTYKNLYFVGGTVHPGGGIPLVILSGKITADLITKNLK